jgi:serine/threonine protein kinase
MEYLHSLKVIHRDLKSKNLLVDKNLNVLVCDYGVSRVMGGQNKTTMTGGMGTVR